MRHRKEDVMYCHFMYNAGPLPIKIHQLRPEMRRGFVAKVTFGAFEWAMFKLTNDELISVLESGEY